MDCGDTGEIITWDDCEESQESRMTTQLTCKVLHTTKCEPQVTELCKPIEYDEWFEQPIEECDTVTILKPKQTFEHKKKCLFHENGNGGGNLLYEYINYFINKHVIGYCSIVRITWVILNI